MTWYRLKVDVVENSYLTTTYDGKNRYSDIEAARFAAKEERKRLFERYVNGEIRGYTVDVVPTIDLI